MKQWPDFNESGDLPPGIHQATLTDVIDHFGKGTPQRQVMARRLEHIYNLAFNTGHLARFIIEKPLPLVVDREKVLPV